MEAGWFFPTSSAARIQARCFPRWAYMGWPISC